MEAVSCFLWRLLGGDFFPRKWDRAVVGRDVVQTSFTENGFSTFYRVSELRGSLLFMRKTRGILASETSKFP